MGREASRLLFTSVWGRVIGVFSGGGVSYESEVRDKEKHSLGTQELLLLCKEAGKHLSNMSYYAFHFTRSLQGHEAIAVFHNFL